LLLVAWLLECSPLLLLLLLLLLLASQPAGGCTAASVTRGGTGHTLRNLLQ
jgi:hypothetical protein